VDSRNGSSRVVDSSHSPVLPMAVPFEYVHVTAELHGTQATVSLETGCQIEGCTLQYGTLVP
jgi:hypothetical protein